MVNDAEMARLNRRFRGKAGPTNVLSFQIEVPAGVDTPHLGDIVICADVIRREAREQGKRVQAHWCHMVVHGVLHLLGYDHENERDGAIMERKETAILSRLGFPNPY
jgi:probable rRNA maturation factor